MRPVIRTHCLSDIDRRQIITLFGTVHNAYHRLKVSEDISYSSFYQMIKGNPVNERFYNAVMTAWLDWRKDHLQQGTMIT